MRTLTLTFILLLVASTSAFAQGFRMSPEEIAERNKANMDEIVTGLALTGDTETKVRTILTEYYDEQGAIFASFAGDRNRESMQMMRAEMADLRELTNEKLEKVLDEEQMKAYNEIVREQRERMRGGRGGPRGPRPGIN